MAVTSSIVGLEVPGIVHHVDERWTMAYAAALGDHRPIYLDTLRDDGVVAHPVFAVCPEWPVIVASRDASLAAGLTAHEVQTSVHATHDSVVHRLIRPGDVLTTRLELVGMVNKSPGAMSTLRLVTVDADGAPVATTTQNGIYLGIAAEGPDRPDPDPPEPLDIERTGEPVEVAVPIGAGDAHTYTECARIWNPIHTDPAVAKRAGLPDIILHGTANLAHGVTAVVEERAGGDPHRVRRIACRFAAMVLLPSELTVRIWPAQPLPTGDETQVAVPFEVLNTEGDPAVKDGVVVLEG